MTRTTDSGPSGGPGSPARGGVRGRIHDLLEPAGEGDLPSRITDFLILAMILFNVVVVIVESAEPTDRPLPAFYDHVEQISVAFFTAEYLLRLWSCVEDRAYTHGLRGRLRFALSPMALVDLLAILPTWIVWLGGGTLIDLRVMRSLRLIRIFRLAKLTRYSNALRTFFVVVRDRRGELATSLFLLAVLLLISASLMYSIENTAQPDKFASIPHAMWWAVATLTTVGYGDVYPETGLGRFLGALIAVLGIGMFALPAGILGAAFTDALEKQREAKAAADEAFCPHCGKPLPGHGHLRQQDDEVG